MNIVGLALIANTEPWVEAARCRETGPDDATWYPEKGSHSDAKKVCASCEVRPDCLAYALAKPEPAGVWGGLTAKERNRLRRGVRPVPPRPVGHPVSCFCPNCNSARKAS